MACGPGTGRPGSAPPAGIPSSFRLPAADEEDAGCCLASFSGTASGSAPAVNGAVSPARRPALMAGNTRPEASPASAANPVAATPRRAAATALAVRPEYSGMSPLPGSAQARIRRIRTGVRPERMRRTRRIRTGVRPERMRRTRLTPGVELPFPAGACPDGGDGDCRGNPGTPAPAYKAPAC
jgi:hypothetical protein